MRIYKHIEVAMRKDFEAVQAGVPRNLRTQCWSCGKEGKERFDHFMPAGVHCNHCWKMITKKYHNDFVVETGHMERNT